MSKHHNQQPQTTPKPPEVLLPSGGVLTTFYALQRGTGADANRLRLVSVQVDLSKTPARVVHPFDLPVVVTLKAEQVMTEAVVKS